MRGSVACVRRGSKGGREQEAAGAIEERLAWDKLARGKGGRAGGRGDPKFLA